MDDNAAYLKYIFNDDIYIIDEPEQGETTEEAQEISTAQPGPEEINEPHPVKFLGSNNKGILILVNETESEFLNQHDLDFLMRIIESGLKYSKLDIAVVNCVRHPYWQIFDEVHHSYLIAFGNHKTKLLDGQSKYNIHENDGIRILIADSLQELESDKEKKTMLWKALQRMFDLN